MKIKTNKGFTVVELLTVVAILAVLGALSLAAFSRFKERQALDVNTQIVAEALREARSKTLDSLEASSYGVHLASSTVSVFKGTSFSPSDPLNEERDLALPVIVASTTLSSSGVYFHRLTGAASEEGSVFIGVRGKSQPVKEIIIESTGLVYVAN